MSASNAMSDLLVLLLTSQNIKHIQESVPKTDVHFSKIQEYPKLLCTFQKSSKDLQVKPITIILQKHWSMHERINENRIQECRYHVRYKWELITFYI